MALRASSREDEVCPVTVVISLGTGMIPVTQLKVDDYRPERLWDNAKLILGFSSLGGLLVDQVICFNHNITMKNN